MELFRKYYVVMETYNGNLTEVLIESLKKNFPHWESGIVRYRQWSDPGIKTHFQAMVINVKEDAYGEYP